jgi:hypothetical protein
MESDCSEFSKGAESPLKKNPSSFSFLAVNKNWEGIRPGIVDWGRPVDLNEMTVCLISIASAPESAMRRWRPPDGVNTIEKVRDDVKK